MNQRTPESGFTLVEMLVSLLLFGIIAVIATGLTAGASRSFATSETALAGIQTLDRTRSLLASDLGQAAERTSVGANGAPLQAFTLTPTGFVLVRRGVIGISPSVQKIAWGFEDGTLRRQSFPAIDSSAPGEASIMVAELQSVSLRVATKSGWQAQWQPERPEQLPSAVELTLVRSNGIPVTLRFLVAA